MNDWAGLLIVVIVIIIVWWLLSRFAKQGPEDINVKSPSEVQGYGDEKKTRSTSLNIPDVSAGVDDLTILEGIGPKVNKLLLENGISTFRQLAEADVDRIKSILDENKLQFMDPTTWPKQAKLVAEGKMEELQVFMDELKGGREV